jgi:hypothetical protein
MIQTDPFGNLYKTKIDGHKLQIVLDECKVMKSEVTLLPRVLDSVQFSGTIRGCSYGFSIHHEMVSTKLLDPYFAVLWDNPELTSIAFYTKDINNMRQMYKEFYKEEADLSKCDLCIESAVYVVNNSTVFLGRRLIDEKSLVNGEYKVFIDLLPTQDFYMSMNDWLTRMNIANINQHAIAVRGLDITENEDFRTIVDAKAGSGAGIWMVEYPENELLSLPKYPRYLIEQGFPYAVSLHPGILNIAKGDKVLFSLYPGMGFPFDRDFDVAFNIIKKKRGVELKVYMRMFKLNMCC